MSKNYFEESESTVLAVVEAPPKETRRESRTDVKPKKEPNYHVVIWNDEEHTYEYVIEMLMKVFKHSFPKAYDITHEVDHQGKGIAWTCHMELAELKRDQVLGFGADWRMPDVSRGSIRASIEAAPE
jgi:ATP-dependent Clp protease adaptor protein ClpS